MGLVLKEATGLGIAGVVFIPLVPHHDERGSLTEVFRGAWVPWSNETLQANLSISRPGVLRGLHFHRQQADYWCVLSGRAFIGLYDLRAGSPTEGRKAEVTIAEGKRHGLYVPPGVAHGFLAETEIWLLYLVDAYFTGEDEFGLGWDDPQVGIGWPISDPSLSERDRSNPPLAKVLEQQPPYSNDARR
jgi:dTDP-4-dehydrorhamnose 3,5-epimerase